MHNSHGQPKRTADSFSRLGTGRYVTTVCPWTTTLVETIASIPSATELSNMNSSDKKSYPTGADFPYQQHNHRATIARIVNHTKIHASKKWQILIYAIILLVQPTEEGKILPSWLLHTYNAS